MSGKPVFFIVPPHANYADLGTALRHNRSWLLPTSLNVNVDDIAHLKHNIAPFEDALRWARAQKSYGTIGDYGLFSFGLFNYLTISAVPNVRDSETASEIEAELSAYKIMSARVLVLTQPRKFSLATQNSFPDDYLSDL